MISHNGFYSVFALRSGVIWGKWGGGGFAEYEENCLTSKTGKSLSPYFEHTSIVWGRKEY